MSVKTQVLDNIKEAYEKRHKNPSIYKKKILSYLYDLQSKNRYIISDTEFFDVVREVFKLDPEYFLKFLYKKIIEKISKLYGADKKRQLAEYIFEKEFIGEIFGFNPVDFMDKIYNDVWQQIGELYGVEKRREIERYILEKYCLYDGEQIFFECNGYIYLKRTMEYKLGVSYATIFLTNYRIIAQGKLRVKRLGGGDDYGLFTGLPKFRRMRSKIKKAHRTKDAVYNIPEEEELPCYGHIFPIKNLYNLKKRIHRNTGNIRYAVKINDQKHIIQITSTSFKRETEENIDKVYDILLKS